MASKVTCKSTTTTTTAATTTSRRRRGSSVEAAPHNNCQEQYLFLLEFYVREIRGPRLAKLNEMFAVPTSVAFCFLDFNQEEGLQVTSEARAGRAVGGETEAFHCGRSVLFALSREDLLDMRSEFKICMSVLKKMPADIKPDVLVGKAQLDLTSQFAALRKELVDAAGLVGEQCPSKSLDAEEVAVLLAGRPVASLSALARVSALGRSVVTEFEAPGPEPSSFLFRAEEGPGYRCRLLGPAESASPADSEPGLGQPRPACAPCRVAGGARASGPRCPAAPIQTSRGPGEPCGRAVVLKVSGLVGPGEEACGPARVTVTGEPRQPEAEPGDPDHDVFVLRIGRKGLVAPGDKSDIQLEMRTPKGPESRPPLRLETREMQTEDEPTGKKHAKPKHNK